MSRVFLSHFIPRNISGTIVVVKTVVSCIVAQNSPIGLIVGLVVVLVVVIIIIVVVIVVLRRRRSRSSRFHTSLLFI